MNARVDAPPLLNRRGLKGLVGPVLIILILAMMVLPLPPFLLDLLFTFNIAIAMIVMLVSLYTQKPLEFAVFPTVLLVTTLLRLSLNVASTRVVLMEGHTGPDAAGKVIEAFGHFLVGGNYTVGIIVFIILVIINFVVITKGAGRIAEVSARFTLDAMPGKQMAIDADLNAGLIGEDEARRRRTEISQEADFFGSMDGASKFVRGDAVAGILILFINVIGGLLVGIFQHNLDIATAANNYTLLAIGDGLVAQIPALIISTAAGMVVSRVATDEDVGQQLIGQLFNKPAVLYITASILGLLGVIPGMPHVAFFILAGTLAGTAYYMEQKALAPEVSAAPPPEAVQAPEMQEVSWNDVMPVDALGLEVGYRLIPLVDRAQDGELLRRIRGIRKKFAQDMGFLVPPVHIRDNLELRPNAYRISLKGVEIGQGEAYAGMYLAINPGRVLGNSAGYTRQPIRHSACRRCGLKPTCATRPRPSDIRWWIPARWWRPISPTSSRPIPPNCWGAKRRSNCWIISPRNRPSWWRNWCQNCCLWAWCRKCCRICSMKACIFVTCAPLSTPWPIMRPAPRMQLT